MALTAPSTFVATTKAKDRIDLTWQNEDTYHLVRIERESPIGGGFSEVGTVPGYKERYEDNNLNAETQYNYRVRGYTFEPEQYSDYSNEDDDTTYGVLVDPTDVVATPISDTQIELTFKDHSSTEDHHRIERKLGAGSWEFVINLEPNREFLRDSGLTKGSSYTYRVRAEEGTSYSNWVESSQVTTISEPNNPFSLSIPEKTDETMRLSWTAGSGNITGTKIEKSATGAFTGEEEEIAKIAEGINEFYVKGLSASTQYWFRVRHYGPGGNSTYSNTANDTTLAQYQRTEFEKFIRATNIKPVYLVEINPKMVLSGFTLTAGKTYTYEITIDDRGINIEQVFEDEKEYTEKTSIAEVEASASSFYFDYDNQKLYCHSSEGTDPDNFLIQGAFWLYFTNSEEATEFNSHHYEPFLSSDDIPDISQEIKPYYEHTFSISAGSVSINNPKMGDGSFYFDKRYAKYIWRNRKLVLMIGGEDFTYSQFKKMVTGIINEVSCNDKKISFSLIDSRIDTDRQVVLNKYTIADYPNLEDGKEDTFIPKFWGLHTGIVPARIDTVNNKYKLHDGRIKEVDAVRKNTKTGTPLTKDTDYFIDYQRGIIEFAEAYSIGDEDIIYVDFRGFVNSADELIENGADIYKDILNNQYGLSNTELDHDSIYGTKYDNEKNLSVPVYKEESFDDIIRTIEHSMKAFSCVDEQGRQGFKTLASSAPSNARDIRNFHILKGSYHQEKGLDSIFKTVNVYYAEDIHTEEWQLKSKTDDDIYNKFKKEKLLDIYTYFSDSNNAETLVTDIWNFLNKDFANFTVKTVLYGLFPGDFIIFSRDRFYNTSGTASEISLRIISISQQPSAGRTQITAEVI